MLTKKGLKVLAAHIRMIMDPEKRLNAAVAVSSAFIEMDPRFDADKFFKECNVNG